MREKQVIVLSVQELAEKLQQELGEILTLRNDLYFKQIDPEENWEAHETANHMGRHIYAAERMAEAIRKWAADPKTD